MRRFQIARTESNEQWLLRALGPHGVRWWTVNGDYTGSRIDIVIESDADAAMFLLRFSGSKDTIEYIPLSGRHPIYLDPPR